MKSNSITFREKMSLVLVLSGLLAVVLSGTFLYYLAQRAITERAFMQMTSAKVFKKRQVESLLFQALVDVSAINRQLITHQDNLEQTEALLSYFSTDERYLSLSYRMPCINKVSENWSSSLLSTQILDLKDSTFIYEKIGNEGLQLFAIAIDSVGTTALLELNGVILNSIMVETDATGGLGATGETYIVGSDMKLRTKSRFDGHEILLTKVESIAVLNGIKCMDSTQVVVDYRDVNVLSSYSKLEVPGIDWVILSEMDYDEALKPATIMLKNLLIGSSFMMLILLLFAVIVAKSITKPIKRLHEATVRLGRGERDFQLEKYSNDEIGALTVAFNQMIKELQLMDEDLKRERNQRLLTLMDGQEMERQRLSRELHDGLGQSLIALRMMVDTLDNCSSDSAQIAEIVQSCDTIITEVREISNNLMPSVLQEFGLQYGINNLINRLNKTSSWNINYTFSKELPTLPREVQIFLYRIVQEALRNAIQHSDATHIDISLAARQSNTVLLVKDNGVGFDLSQNIQGNGLQNMRERAQLLGGSLQIETSPNNGTKICTIIPIKDV